MKLIQLIPFFFFFFLLSPSFIVSRGQQLNIDEDLCFRLSDSMR